MEEMGYDRIRFRVRCGSSADSSGSQVLVAQTSAFGKATFPYN
jgi:hypothetical protein